jgi:hypothetical protein
MYVYVCISIYTYTNTYSVIRYNIQAWRTPPTYFRLFGHYNIESNYSGVLCMWCLVLLQGTWLVFYCCLGYTNIQHLAGINKYNCHCPRNNCTTDRVLGLMIETCTFRMYLTLYSLAVSLSTTRFNIKKFHMVLALRWAFCTDLRTDSDLPYAAVTGFYNRGGKCLQHGTDWFLI